MKTLPWDHIQRAAKKHSIDPLLMGAIVKQESNGRSDVIRYESHIHQRQNYILKPGDYASLCGISRETEIVMQSCSWGLGQLMGFVLRELGYKACLTNAIDPDVNLDYMGLKLKELFRRYTKEEEVISAYNAGSVRMNNGMYVNHKNYVDPIYRNLREWRK